MTNINLVNGILAIKKKKQMWVYLSKLLPKSISCSRLQGVTTVAARCVRTKFNCTMFESMSANTHVMIPRWLYSNCVLLHSFRAYVQFREGVVMVVVMGEQWGRREDSTSGLRLSLTTVVMIRHGCQQCLLSSSKIGNARPDVPAVTK